MNTTRLGDITGYDDAEVVDEEQEEDISQTETSGTQCILNNPNRAIGLEYHAEWNKKQLIVGSWKERNV